MEKELLQKKKDEIVICKEKMKKIVTEAETLTVENEQLNKEYQETVDYIEELNQDINDYILSKRINKVSKILLIISIISVLGISCLICLVPPAAPTFLLSKITASLTMTLLIGGITSIPYVSTTKYLKNINIEEIKSQLKLEEEEKNTNRETYEKNNNKINSLIESNKILYNSLYNTTLELLDDKEICQDSINYIINNEPSEEVIYVLADSILETSKTKIKK